MSSLLEHYRGAKEEDEVNVPTSSLTYKSSSGIYGILHKIDRATILLCLFSAIINVLLGDYKSPFQHPGINFVFLLFARHNSNEFDSALAHASVVISDETKHPWNANPSQRMFHPL